MRATPVVSGNVSLYNETDGQAIDPAPVIGMVGSIDDIATAVGIAMPKGGETIFVIGQDETATDGWLGASVYADLLTPNPEAAPPPLARAISVTAQSKPPSEISCAAVT